jgi:predicted small metal-binding protein
MDTSLLKGANHARDAHGVEKLDDAMIQPVKSKIRNA